MTQRENQEFLFTWSVLSLNIAKPLWKTSGRPCASQGAIILSIFNHSGEALLGDSIGENDDDWPLMATCCSLPIKKTKTKPITQKCCQGDGINTVFFWFCLVIHRFLLCFVSKLSDTPSGCSHNHSDSYTVPLCIQGFVVHYTQPLCCTKDLTQIWAHRETDPHTRQTQVFTFIKNLGTCWNVCKILGVKSFGCWNTAPDLVRVNFPSPPNGGQGHRKNKDGARGNSYQRSMSVLIPQECKSKIDMAFMTTPDKPRLPQMVWLLLIPFPLCLSSYL